MLFKNIVFCLSYSIYMYIDYHCIFSITIINSQVINQILIDTQKILRNTCRYKKNKYRGKMNI